MKEVEKELEIALKSISEIEVNEIISQRMG